MLQCLLCAHVRQVLLLARCRVTTASCTYKACCKTLKNSKTMQKQPYSTPKIKQQQHLVTLPYPWTCVNGKSPPALCTAAHLRWLLRRSLCLGSLCKAQRCASRFLLPCWRCWLLSRLGCSRLGLSHLFRSRLGINSLGCSRLHFSRLGRWSSRSRASRCCLCKLPCALRRLLTSGRCWR